MQKRKRITLPTLLFFIAIQCFSQNRNSYNVMDYGATGNKENYATKAIQTTIDSCAANGGGTVYFPAGDYLSAKINLRDNIHLHLDAGATLWASGKEEDYKKETFVDNTVGAKSGVLISAIGLKNISITGKGTIQGQPQHSWEPLKEIDTFIEWEQKNAEKHGIPMERAYCLPPKISLIYLIDCENVHLDGISVINSPNWGVHIQWCNRVFVSNLYIESDPKFGVNSDGLDIDGSREVVVNNCVILTGDDAICLKSTNKLGEYRDCENITINNCIVQSSSAGLKLGTESHGDFRNIQFTNCIVRKANRGLGIIVRDGGTVENVLFSNITIHGQRNHLEWWGDGEAFRLVVLKRNPDSKIGKIKNVRFENITAHIEGYNRIVGLENKEIENVTIQNVQLFMNPESEIDKRTDHAIKIKEAKGITIKDVYVQWDEENPEPLWKSALSMENVEQAEVSKFKARQGLVESDYPAIQLNNCQDVLIRHCIENKKTGNFIGVMGSGTEKILLWNNLTHEADKKLSTANEVHQDQIRIIQNNE